MARLQDYTARKPVPMGKFDVWVDGLRVEGEIDAELQYFRVPRYRWLPTWLARLPGLGRWEQAIQVTHAPPKGARVTTLYETDFSDFK
jgi:hypothetical protein